MNYARALGVCLALLGGGSVLVLAWLEGAWIGAIMTMLAGCGLISAAMQ